MDKVDEALTRGVEKIYPSRKALEKVLRSGKKIRLYQGFDPSMPNLHLGNLVGILKLKQFQKLGHEVIFLVGDFTGMIGDPSDKSSARPRLTRKQVLTNCKNWKSQAGRILSFSGKNPAKLMFNSQWNDKVTFKELIEIAANFTVQQMLERDFFRRRLKDRRPIFLHEFLYPVAQATDAVKMDVDLEIGGSDQTFNMLCGRTLMKAIKGKEKFVLTTKLLVDARGEKVGKTTGNALFLDASPADFYGGIMSFPDEVIILAFELLTDIPLQIIKEREKALSARGGQAGKINPMEVKKELAYEVVKMYYGNQKAKAAREEFERVFQKRNLPSQIPKKIIPKKMVKGKFKLFELVYYSASSPSKSEAKRIIKQGGVEFNGKVINNPNFEIDLKGGEILKVGKLDYKKIYLG